MAAHRNEFNSQTREDQWEKRERSRDRAQRILHEKVTLTYPPNVDDSQAKDALSILLSATDSNFPAMETISQLRMQIEDLDILVNNALDLIDQAMFQMPPQGPIVEQRRLRPRKQVRG